MIQLLFPHSPFDSPELVEGPIPTTHKSARSSVDRASASGAESRWFEPSRAYHIFTNKNGNLSNQAKILGFVK